MGGDRDAFEAMVLELMENPEVEVLECEIGAPIDAVHLDDVEAALGQRLPEGMRRFYLDLDGVRLRWVHHHHPRRRPVERWDGPDASRLRSAWDHLIDEQREDGRILIRSAEETFAGDAPLAGNEERLSGDPPSGEISLASLHGPRADFYRSLRVFDAYSEEGGAALTIHGGVDRVVLGSNSGASYEDLDVTDFRSYLDFLLASRGLVDARHHFYARHFDRSRSVGSTGWTASDFVGLFRSYEWQEIDGASPSSWHDAAIAIAAGEARPCPACSADLRHAWDHQVVVGSKRSLWLWCGACRGYSTVSMNPKSTVTTSASFSRTHPSIGYWLDHANAGWARQHATREL